MTANGIVDGLLDLMLPDAASPAARRAPGSVTSAPPHCGHCRRERCPRCGAPGRWSAPAPGASSGPAAPERSLARAAHGGDPRRLILRPGGRRCPECGGRDLAFASASSAFTYEGPARALVTACKFRALRSLTQDMVERAAPAFAAAAQDAFVTWVPGHRDHQLERGFNQAERLARGFARTAGLPYAPLLRRTRLGARQSGLSRAARAANVKDAFALLEGTKGVQRKLKRVVIVDDVYTTGETLDQCAQVLAQAGLEPRVFTFARTVRATPSQASLDHAVQKERCP